MRKEASSAKVGEGGGDRRDPWCTNDVTDPPNAFTRSIACVPFVAQTCLLPYPQKCDFRFQALLYALPADIEVSLLRPNDVPDQLGVLSEQVLHVHLTVLVPAKRHAELEDAHRHVIDSLLCRVRLVRVATPKPKRVSNTLAKMCLKSSVLEPR